MRGYRANMAMSDSVRECNHPVDTLQNDNTVRPNNKPRCEVGL